MGVFFACILCHAHKIFRNFVGESFLIFSSAPLLEFKRYNDIANIYNINIVSKRTVSLSPSFSFTIYLNLPIKTRIHQNRNYILFLFLSIFILVSTKIFFFTLFNNKYKSRHLFRKISFICWHNQIVLVHTVYNACMLDMQTLCVNTVNIHTYVAAVCCAEHPSFHFLFLFFLLLACGQSYTARSYHVCVCDIVRCVLFTLIQWKIPLCVCMLM